MWIGAHHPHLATHLSSIAIQKLLLEVATSTFRLPASLQMERGKKFHTIATTSRISKPTLEVLAARANYTIQRFKAWRNDCPRQLWETTMDPTTRNDEAASRLKIAPKADRILHNPDG